MANSAFETCRCPACQTSVDLPDGKISLAKATAEGNIAEVRRLLEQGTQYSPRDLADPTSFYRFILKATQGLHSYCWNMVPQCWSRTSIKESDEKGQITLHLAVESRFPQMVALPLDRGAAMSAQVHGGRTTLQLMAERGIRKMTKLLIDQRAEASPMDGFGRKPLYLSVQLEYEETTKLLVAGGALVSTVNNSGCKWRTQRETLRKRRA